MLQNAYFLAKIGADTAENERKFAKIGKEEAARAARNGAAERAVGRRAARAAPEVRLEAGRVRREYKNVCKIIW